MTEADAIRFHSNMAGNLSDPSKSKLVDTCVKSTIDIIQGTDRVNYDQVVIHTLFLTIAIVGNKKILDDQVKKVFAEQMFPSLSPVELYRSLLQTIAGELNNQLFENASKLLKEFLAQ